MHPVKFSSSIIMVPIMVGSFLLAHWISANEYPVPKDPGPPFTETADDIMRTFLRNCDNGAGSDERECGEYFGRLTEEMDVSESLTQAQIDEQGIVDPPVQDFLERVSGYVLGNYGQFLSPFGVDRFPDGTGTGEGTNQYAWGADFSDNCGVGIVIHSAGTLAIQSGAAANPTLVVRDYEGHIVYKETLPIQEIGLRSAVITTCTKDGEPFTKGMRENFLRSLGFCFWPLNTFLPCDEEFADAFTVFSGNLSPFFGGARLIKLDVNIADETVTISNEVVFGFNVTSIRALDKLDDCKLVLAPLDDTRALLSPVGPPELVVYDTCTKVRTTNILSDLTGTPITRFRPVWDFDVGDNGDIWVNLIDINLDAPDKIGGFDFSPLLYKTSVSELAVDGVDFNLRVPLVPVPLGVDSSAYSLLSLNGGSEILACSISGFLYQQLTTGFAILADFSFDVIFEAEEFLASTELAEPQECRFCTSASGGSACTKVDFLPPTRTAVPYIWNIVECDKFVFAGTLDINFFLANVLIQILLGFIGAELPFLELFGEDVGAGVLELAAGFGLGFFFSEILTPLDFGFDLYYTLTSSIGKGGVFIPVTFDGFRTYNDDGDYRGYSPLDDVDEGVRNMVCHTDFGGGRPRLVVGSAIYGASQPSSTYVLRLF